jgi:hypothetical protein
VPKDIRLIGPAKFTPPGSRYVDRPGIKEVSVRYPKNAEIKIVEGVFMTILKNEFGVNSWVEFDKKIGEAIGFPVVGEPGSVLEAETRLAQTVDSEKVFKYALDCEYRIKI